MNSDLLHEFLHDVEWHFHWSGGRRAPPRPEVVDLPGKVEFVEPAAKRELHNCELWTTTPRAAEQAPAAPVLWLLVALWV